MKIHLSYFKNSNSGQIIKRQHFESEIIRGLKDIFYDISGHIIEDANLDGFVEISEIRFLRERRKMNKSV